jgi:hypothetical protein
VCDRARLHLIEILIVITILGIWPASSRETWTARRSQIAESSWTSNLETALLYKLDNALPDHDQALRLVEKPAWANPRYARRLSGKGRFLGPMERLSVLSRLLNRI